MPCCAILLIGLLGPRIAIVLIAFFSDYLGRAYDSFLIPLLGWVFLPWTTLAYAWAINSRGEVVGFQAAVVVIAVLIDLGVIGGGAAKRKRDE
jgi:hypothetical protein